MTTFQDPPPHSRRAVRQSERGESAPNATTSSAPDGAPYDFENAAPEQPSHSANTSTPTPPPSGRRAAQGRVAPPSEGYTSQSLGGQPAPGETAEQAAFRLRDYSPEGRRSASPRNQTGPVSPAASFAPPARPVELDYHTQGVAPGGSHSAAPQAPLDDDLNHTLTRRELREMRAAAEAAAPPLQVPSSENWRPEAIDTLLNSGPIEIPTLAPPPGQSQALAEAMAEFDLLTRARRESEARARDAQVASLATPIVTPTAPQEPAKPVQAEAPQIAAAEIASAPIASVPAAPVVAEEAAASEVEVPAEPVDYPPTSALPSAPVATAASAPESSPFDELLVPSVQEPPVLAVPVFSDQPGSAPVQSVASAPVPHSDAVVPAETAAGETAADAPALDSPAPISSFPVSSVPVSSIPISIVPTSAAPVVPVQTSSTPTGPIDEQTPGGRSPRASGHWRVQAAIEDDEQPYENTLSRTVGSNTSAITTSALVLPSVPQPDSILNNLTATGEILVTGTIDLPRSLGSTGAHPSRVDNSDFEDDPLDSQIAAPDSAPIRAIRAVSSNTSSRAVIETKRPTGTRLLTGVIIVASVLCVGLVGLLVYAFASNKL